MYSNHYITSSLYEVNTWFNYLSYTKYSAFSNAQQAQYAFPNYLLCILKHIIDEYSNILLIFVLPEWLDSNIRQKIVNGELK